jgi:hypothetical protein
MTISTIFPTNPPVSGILGNLKRRFDAHSSDEVTSIEVNVWINLDPQGDEPLIECDVFDVPCPECESGVGESCTTGDDTPHRERTMVAAAIRVLFKKGIES